MMKFRSRIVPHAYIQTEYLESTGTQYIDTGLKGSLGMAVELKYRATTPAANNILNIFGDITTSTSALSCNTGYGGVPAQPTSRFGNKSTGAIVQNLVVDTDYTITTNKNAYTIKRQDGSVAYTYSYNTTTAFTTTNNLWAFVCNNSNAPSTYTGGSKFYYCKIWDNNVLVRDFIPVVRKIDNVAGMYDLVEGKFYSNAGTGAFISGPIVKTTDKVRITDKEVQELRLPYNGNKYKFFDYIESTGTQYIDTGVIPTNTTGIQVVADICADNNTDNIIFGSRQDSGQTRFWIDMDWGRTDTLGWGFNDYTAEDLRYPISGKAGTKHTIGLNYLNDRAGTVDGVVYDNSLSTKSLVNITRPISLFAGNNSGTIGLFVKTKVYSCKISKDSTLIRDFIPAQRLSDNAIGMYDKITNTFFENKGTGVFKTGNEIVSIPNEYERLEYLESSGTQYIDTGFKPNNNTHIKVDVYSTNTTNNIVNLGCWNSAYNNGAFSLTNGANSGASIYAGYDGQGGNLISGRVTNFPATFELDKNLVKVNDVVKYTFTTSTFSVNYNLTLFATNRAGTITWAQDGTTSKYAISSCKIWENNILVRNLFPVRRKADNVLGMLDLVNNVFYTNRGTGSFTTSTNTMPNKVMMPFWKRYPDVPKEYEVKEYLESDGYAQIDSGIRFTQGDKIDMVGRFIDPQHDDGLICMTPWNQGSNSRFMFAVATQGGSRVESFCMAYNTHPGGENRVSPYFTPDTEYHRWTYEDLTLTIDDGVSSLTNTDAYPTTPTGTIYLFRRFNGACKTAIKYYKHWRNGQLIASYVPVMRKSDGTLGFYDVTTDKFLTNVGTGSFTAG